MAAKKTNRPLPKYMTATAYKYQRRVPVSVAKLVGQKIWDLSLGSNLQTAVERCAKLTAQHDRLIAFLSDKEALQEAKEDVLAVTPAANLLAMIENEHEELEATWRDIEDYVDGARGLTPRRELETLAIFAYQAFGDAAYMDQIANPTAMLTVAKQLPVAPPPSGDDRIALATFNAMKSVLDDRLAEINAAKPSDPDRTITARMDQYITYKAVKSSTARVQNAHPALCAVCRQPNFRSNKMAPTPKVSGPTASRNGALFCGAILLPIKSLYKWALKEDIVDVDPSERIDIPNNNKTVEESRWQAFNQNEIKIT